MVTLAKGLINSLIVLEYLRNNSELSHIDISVGTFTNCRECGLTFIVTSATIEGELKVLNPFTWCIYEHRNSDEIIINGVPKYISMNGELPYNGESKYNYLHAFNYSEHMDAADKLAELITNWVNSQLTKSDKQTASNG